MEKRMRPGRATDSTDGTASDEKYLRVDGQRPGAPSRVKSRPKDGNLSLLSSYEDSGSSDRSGALVTPLELVLSPDLRSLVARLVPYTSTRSPHPLLTKVVLKLASLNINNTNVPTYEGLVPGSETIVVQHYLNNDAYINDKLMKFYGMISLYTHEESMQIHAEDIFEVNVNFLTKARVLDLKKKLGIFVRFVRKSDKCKFDDCIVCPMSHCKVCPHMVRCPCQQKCAITNFCPHIHVMKDTVCWKNGDENGCVLINQSWHKMKMRHLQAACMGAGAMIRMKDASYRETNRILLNKKTHRVVLASIECSCPPLSICPVCRACRCRLRCNCDDYKLWGRVCAHCHNVALNWFNSVGAAPKVLDFHYPPEDAEDDDDHNSSYSVGHIQRRIVIEHEKSYNIREMDVNQLWANLWSVRGSNTDVTHVVVYRENCEYFCDCREYDLPKNRCLKCRICVHSYLCTCAIYLIEENFICQHIHAVHRFSHLKNSLNSNNEYEEIKLYCPKQINDLVRDAVALAMETSPEIFNPDVVPGTSNSRVGASNNEASPSNAPAGPSGIQTGPSNAQAGPSKAQAATFNSHDETFDHLTETFSS